MSLSKDNEQFAMDQDGTRTETWKALKIDKPVSRQAMWCLALSMLCASLGTTSINVGLPTLADVFEATFQSVQWVVLAYLLVVTSLVVVVGRIGDLVGRRRLLLGGLWLFGGASIACGGAPSLEWLVAGRALQGVGGAILGALALALVVEAVPPARAGRAMGVLATMAAAGTAAGPSIGGALIDLAGWPAIFFINVPLVLVALAFGQRALPTDATRTRSNLKEVALSGSAVLMGTLLSYALAVTLGQGQAAAVKVVLFGVASLGMLVFVRIQRRSAMPLIPHAILADRVRTSQLTTPAIVMTVLMATLVVGPFYLTGALGLTTTTVGFVMAIGPLTVTLASVPAGQLADRFGPGRITRVGLWVAAAGAILLASMPVSLGLMGYVVPLVVLTFGYALFHTSNNTVVMAKVEPGQRGVISGLLNLSRNLGLITGTAVMGALFAAATGTMNIVAATPGAVAYGFSVTFAIGAVLLVGAYGMAAWTRPKTARPPRPEVVQ